ncbi:MAG: DUF2791 family P-loop domain-containing protein [Bauldia sp.]|nr:DUF2791 family P-loop domain-containing protein [Bauldia sp.]
MAIAPGLWLDVMRREYFGRFIPEGGASTKFIAFADDPDPATEGLRRIAADGNLLIVPVESAETKIHMIQDVFFALARLVPWENLAQRWIERTFAENRYTWTRPGEAVPLRELAEANRVDEVLLRKSIHQWATDLIMRDRDLSQDFRAAMVSLCLQRMDLGDGSTTAPVLEWLRGELRTIGAVRQVPISAKITRHNGRAMLRSLCHWLRLSAEPGLLVLLDIRHAIAGAKDGVRYSPAALLDLYEVLRQLIDDAENVSGLFVAVVADPRFRDGDPRRDVGRYAALKERIWPDVNPRGHDDPVAPMLQLDPARPVPATVTTTADLPISAERVAVEALRSGVPNRTAIRLLGSAEDQLIARFVQSLAAVSSGLAGGRAVRGDILSGGFGSGKSHLLGVLAERALDEKFVVSVVPVSKETPLFDPARFFLAAMRAAVVPGANDDVMTEVLRRVSGAPGRCLALEEWASDPRSGLSPIFAAILHVLPRQLLTPEDKVAVARFFAGHRIGVARVNQWLRAIGLRGKNNLFDLKGIREADLVPQRIRFAPRLFQAAGFNGWCVLIDEAELIGRYSALQRGKSYAELTRWLHLDAASGVPGIASAAAIVTDFRAAVLGDRLDLERVPRLLRDRGLDVQADLAVAAMAALDGKATELRAPDEEVLRHSLDRVRGLYRASYGWEPPPIDIGPRRQRKSMREYIKSWVIEWDLRRIYGDAGDLATNTIRPDLTENLDLETAPADLDEDAEA